MTRTDACPDPGEPEPGARTFDVLVLAVAIELSAVDVAVPAAAVREVVRIDRLTPYPSAPVDVAGIAAVRGQIVLVLDVAPHVRQRPSGDHGAAGGPAVLVTASGHALALRGGTPVRLSAATPVVTGPDDPSSVALWSGRALPLAGAVRLADAPRSDAADRSVLPLLDVAALLADVIDSAEGGT